MAEPTADAPAHPPIPRRVGVWARSGRLRSAAIALFFLAGAAILVERELPIDAGKASRLASAFLVLADPAFRPAAFRAGARPRDFGRGERECWEVGFFDRQTGARYRGFYVYVYLADGLCTLSHSPRFGPKGERYMEGAPR